MSRKIIGGLIQCANPINDETRSVEQIKAAFLGSADAADKFVAKLDEPALAVDPTSAQKAEQLPTYNAYSTDGDVTAPLVYVNYGVPEDYEQLERLELVADTYLSVGTPVQHAVASLLEAGANVRLQIQSRVRENLTQIAPVFTKQKFMLGDEFSMLDVAIAPLLWRLEHYGIELPKVAAPVLKYRERLFSRPAFINALTPTEKALRK